MPEFIENQKPALWAEAELPPREPAPRPVTSETEREARLKPINRNQLLLRTVDVDKLVERDHLVRAIWELTGWLDLKSFHADVGSVEGVAGRPAFDPRLLTSLWVCAYSEGVSSAREVERRCGYHPAYQWLTGCEVINYHTLSDFRIQHQEALDALFAQLLGVLSSEGLITLERVMHDGTKVKASASTKSFHREKTARPSRSGAGAGAGDGRSSARGIQPARTSCSGASGPRESGKTGTSPERNGESSSCHRLGVEIGTTRERNRSRSADHEAE